MSNSVPAANHTYTIELRFYGDLLDPAEVSSILNLQPSRSSNGKPIGKRKREPFWGYDGSDHAEFQEPWQSLEDGLAFVSQKLASRKPAIIQLGARFDGIWWCGHFQTSFDGGPTLSAGVLGEVASFGLPLFLDTYHSADDDG
jgi:hypothetical protein